MLVILQKFLREIEAVRVTRANESAGRGKEDAGLFDESDG